MITVVSQAWTRNDAEAADGFIEASRKLGEFMLSQPGYRGRKLIRGVEDRTHFTHLRWFDSVEHYDAMTDQPGYREHIQEMSEFLNLERYQDTHPREFMEVVLDEA